MKSFTPQLLNQAVQLLRDGGVVAFPTDTVYGVGVDPLQPEAVRKLYRIKGRPDNKPIAILVGSIEDVERVAQTPSGNFSRLAERFWPGGLTLIVEARDLPPEITAGGSTVGVRMPNHPLTLELLRGFGGPIATTSANRSGEPPATSAEEVGAQLGDCVNLIVDGGDTITKVASTVLNLSMSPPQILRQGAISEESLMECLDSEKCV
ncbi:MAG: L-threonylcarbamoyladenylate synthase [Candidatus Poribacteria bacterium]|nr:L-threonylcarbamoyladenylate synthase [Candidatus Poribacteria bacterium]